MFFRPSLSRKCLLHSCFCLVCFVVLLVYLFMLEYDSYDIIWYNLIWLCSDQRYPFVQRLKYPSHDVPLLLPCLIRYIFLPCVALQIFVWSEYLMFSATLLVPRVQNLLLYIACPSTHRHICRRRTKCYKSPNLQTLQILNLTISVDIYILVKQYNFNKARQRNSLFE